jgi:phospholipid-binding lipoprotein MlaA
MIIELIRDAAVPFAFRLPMPAAIGAALVSLLLSACGPAALPPGDSVVDRDEAQNREIHAFNLSVDRALVGPASGAYGNLVPPPVRRGIDNFAANLNQPGYVLNNLLQFRLGDAVENTLRFAVNTTVGIGGLFDPASAIGLPARDTDFGETLHIYGVPEGAFVMLPVLGPSTSRDTLGMVVDIATNPLRYVLHPPESHYMTAAELAGRFSARQAGSGTIESVLYESADSYAALRSLYLQNRRFELGGADLSYEDPYDQFGDGDEAAAADPTLDPYYDPYSDPYLDPYDL